MTPDVVGKLLALGRRAAQPLPKVGATPADVVFAENKWRLWRTRPRAEGLAFRTPVLLVPSLINRHYVLDLMAGKSLTSYLVEQGHDVFTVDWGTPGDEDRFLSFDDFADHYLGRAVRRSALAAGVERVHLFGYCLGGTLAAIHAARRPERIQSLLALAGPVRFHDEGLLSTWTRSRAFDSRAFVEAFGNAPWPLMQAAFHLLRPTLTLSKLVHLWHRADDPAFLDGFLALERWGNDNVSFPGRAFEEYLMRLYREDALAGGRLHVSGRRVDLCDIRCPTLAVTFEHDNIVPWRSAAALLQLVSSAEKEHLHFPGGHVGTLVSSSARQRLWPLLSDFWAKHAGTGRPKTRTAGARATAN
jgi:polyhydroxyalkanoate synthase subunit PhaC